MRVMFVLYGSLQRKFVLKVWNKSGNSKRKFTNYKMPALLSTFGPHTMNSEDGETYQGNNIIKATSQVVSENIKIV